MNVGYESETKLENETKVIEEEKLAPQRRRKGVYLEENEESQDAIFRLSKKQLDTLREKAKEKGISMASYVREALVKSFASEIPVEKQLYLKHPSFFCFLCCLIFCFLEVRSELLEL